MPSITIGKEHAGAVELASGGSWAREARDPQTRAAIGADRPTFLASFLQNLSNADVPDAPHGLNWTHALELNRALLEFLR